MSAPPALVAASTVALGSPALWLLAHDQLSLDSTLVRLGICGAACWLALSAVAGLVPTPSRAPRNADAATLPEEEPEQVS